MGMSGILVEQEIITETQQHRVQVSADLMPLVVTLTREAMMATNGEAATLAVRDGVESIQQQALARLGLAEVMERRVSEAVAVERAKLTKLVGDLEAEVAEWAAEHGRDTRDAFTAGRYSGLVTALALARSVAR